MNKPFLPEDLRRERPATIARAVIAYSVAALKRSILPDEYARKTWGNDRDLELVMRAAVSPHTLINTPALTQIAKAFLETLIPASAGYDLLRRGLQLSFGGKSQISLPNITVPAADFVAEGAPIPIVTAPTSAGPSLVPHKLAVGDVLTHAMVDQSDAEAVVNDALVKATGPGIDKVLFSTAAAGPDRPAGLLNGIAGLTPSTGGTGTNKTQAIVDDLQALATAVAPVAGNGNIVLVASPDAAVALVLRLPASVTWPVLTSNSLAARTVLAVASNAIASAVEGTPQIRTSEQGTIHRDTAPSDIVSGGTAAVPVTSLFQTDSVGYTLVWPISWILRQSNGVAWMTNVNW
jgi:hypothetical protein